MITVRANRTRLIALAVATGIAMSMLACSSGASGTGGSDDATQPPIVIVDETVAASLPVSVTSADGREVTIEDNSRIVPLWGSLAEIAFGLGLGDNVVARDISTTFPEALDLPLITRAHDISAEGVLSLQPSVVIGSTTSGPEGALDHIRNVGVPVVLFEEPTSVDDIIPRIHAVAEALGVPAAGDSLAAATQQDLDDAKATIPADVETPLVAFLYMRGNAGVYLIAGPGSGADSMIKAAGGVDAGTELGLTNPFTPLTSEALVRAAPDVILMTTTGLESVGGIDGLLTVPGIAQTPAGENRRVVTVEDGLLYSFGPRTPEALRELITKLYDSPREATQ